MYNLLHNGVQSLQWQIGLKLNDESQWLESPQQIPCPLDFNMNYIVMDQMSVIFARQW